MPAAGEANKETEKSHSDSESSYNGEFIELPPGFLDPLQPSNAGSAAAKNSDSESESSYCGEYVELPIGFLDPLPPPPDKVVSGSDCHVELSQCSDEFIASEEGNFTAMCYMNGQMIEASDGVCYIGGKSKTISIRKEMTYAEFEERLYRKFMTDKSGFSLIVIYRFPHRLTPSGTVKFQPFVIGDEEDFKIMCMKSSSLSRPELYLYAMSVKHSAILQ